VRAAAGVGLVQRQARLPVPPRLHQRHPPRPHPAEAARAGKIFSSGHGTGPCPTVASIAWIHGESSSLDASFLLSLRDRAV
jgi:hypothetical protein